MDDWRYKPARDLGLPLGQRLRSIKRETGMVGRLTHRAWWAAMSAYLRCTQKLTIHGQEHLPASPPFILAANHSSHLDAVVLAIAIPPALRWCVFPIAAGDTFFETPAHSVFAAGAMNALPMWRKNCGRHAMEELRSRLLDEPCGFILFPEGTRSRSGEMAAFRPGLGMIVAGTVAPVIPVCLHGTFDAWPPQARRPRRGQRIEVRIGPALEFAGVANDREGWQRIAGEVESAVRALKAHR